MAKSIPDMDSTGTKTRVLRVIARLNVGGPSIQAIALSRHLQDRGYETRLVRGRESPREGSMDPLAEALGVRPIDLPSLRRDIGLGDAAALLFLARQLREWQPEILHTHAAKAGTLGRLAALLSGRRPPVIVHTFHGHVLSGYFSRPVSKTFIAIERALARFTTCIVAVSKEVRDDLVRLRIAPPEKIVVIPLGFDFAGYDVPEAARRSRRNSVRQSLGIPDAAQLVTLVARLEPIKRVDRFLRVARSMNRTADARFLVVGDGKLREELQRSPQAQALGKRLTCRTCISRVTSSPSLPTTKAPPSARSRPMQRVSRSSRPESAECRRWCMRARPGYSLNPTTRPGSPPRSKRSCRTRR
jgi:glycosyltransferase involved in cell wall biosynthesis